MVQGIRPEAFYMAFTVAQCIHQAKGCTGFLEGGTYAERQK